MSLRNSSLKFHGPFSDGLYNTRNSALGVFEKELGNFLETIPKNREFFGFFIKHKLFYF